MLSNVKFYIVVLGSNKIMNMKNVTFTDNMPSLTQCLLMFLTLVS